MALPDFFCWCYGRVGFGDLSEIYLLVDENSTALSRQTVALDITRTSPPMVRKSSDHEVVDDLWLSFANMMEYVSVDAIEPSWKILKISRPVELICPQA